MPKQSDYSVGDVVFWGTPTTAGELLHYRLWDPVNDPKLDRALGGEVRGSCRSAEYLAPHVSTWSP